MAASSKHPQVAESLKSVLALLHEANDLETSDVSRYSGHLVLADAQLGLLNVATREDVLVKHMDVLHDLSSRNWAGDVKRAVTFMFKKYGLPNESTPAAIELKLNGFAANAVIINKFIKDELAYLTTVETIAATMSKRLAALSAPTAPAPKAIPLKKKIQRPITFFL